MIGDHTHRSGEIFVFFARNLLEFFDNWQHNTNFEDIWRADFRRCDSLQTATEIDIFVFERFKRAVLKSSIFHKYLVTDLHKSTTVAGWVSFAKAGVVIFFTKVIKNFRIWTTRIANRCRIQAAATTPPVFFVVVEENSPALKPKLVAIFSRAKLNDFRVNSFFGKNFLPNSRRFVISRNAVFLITNKARNIDFRRIKPDHIC